MKYSYFPILKTTDAELKAYANLNDDVKDGLLPTFELTRSRRSKNNPNADIGMRIDKLKDMLKGRHFILDLTTESSLSNAQIVDMLNMPQKGYDRWVTYVKQLKQHGMDKLIPMIHFNPLEIDEVRSEIRFLARSFSYLAFRVSINDTDSFDYIKSVLSEGNSDQLIIILDGEFIENSKDNGDKSSYFIPLLNNIRDLKKNLKVVSAFSSFPSAVNQGLYGEYNHGKFIISEIPTSDVLMKSHKHVCHGDYGSVHPVRYEISGGKWIPRIDFIKDHYFHYYRYQREQGGYIEAAKKVINDEAYEKIKELKVWGDSEIEAAANDIPNGLNPSHWIAVRINLYITRQYLRLKEANCMSL